MTTRRDFLVAASALAASSALASVSALARGSAPGSAADVGGAHARLAASSPVVAFFDGQLWLDTSGASVAYRSPTAARAMPSFTHEELTRARGYI
jgi:hypothetical protein